MDNCKIFLESQTLASSAKRSTLRLGVLLAAGWGPRLSSVGSSPFPTLQTCARREAAHASSPSRRTKSTMTSLCVVPAAVASARRAATPGASGAPARALCAARARAPNAKVRAGPPETSPFFEHDRVRRAPLPPRRATSARPIPTSPPGARLAAPSPRPPVPAAPPDATDKNIRCSNSNPNPTRRVPNADPDPPPLALAPIPSLSSARASPSSRVPAAPSRPARPPATATRSSPSSSPPSASPARSPPPTTTKTPTTRSTSTATSPSRRRSSRRASRRPSARTTSSARRWRS